MTNVKAAEIIGRVVEKYSALPPDILFNLDQHADITLCNQCLSNLLIRVFIEGLKYSAGQHSYYLSEVSRN